jgi:PAS domain S-box-containing protein
MTAMTALPAASWRRVLILPGLLFLGLYLAWLVWGRQDPWERLLLGNLVLLFTTLLTGLLSVWIRQRVQEPRLRRAWGWLSAGLLLWLLADITRLVRGMDAGVVLSLAPVDAIYLLGSVPLWVGLALYPRQPRQSFGRLGLLLEMALTTAAVLTFVWLFVLQPALAYRNSFSYMAGMLYPLSDLISLILLLNLILTADTRSLPLPFGWISLGLMAYISSDLAYTARLLNAGYQTGSLVDFGWVLGDGLLVMAVLTQSESILERRRSPASEGLQVRLQMLLPVLTTLALAVFTLINWTMRGRLDQLGVWATLVLCLGLIARQGILAGEIEMQQYANLVNSVAEPAFVCDARGRLVLVNPALLTSAGYQDAPHLLLGHPLAKLLSSGEDAQRLIAEGLRRGWSGELPVLRQDGSSFPASLSLRPLRPSGRRSLALAGTAHDLSVQVRQQQALQVANEQINNDRTELERLNSRLEQLVAEKTADLTTAYHRLEEQNLALQQLDQLKSDFVSLVSHELRAPLTNINSGIELLLSRSARLPARATTDLELVQAEITRLTRFVETILDLSALDAGKLPLYPAPTSLAGVVEALQQQARHHPSGGRVDWCIDPDLPAVLADDQAINSVLYHLLENAFKYAPEGRIRVCAGQEYARVWVEVSDEGPGIPPESLPLLFGRFSRPGAKDAQTVYGHGLGLYIVRRLVEAMDGEVQAGNRVEGGACFRFWLPAVE